MPLGAAELSKLDSHVRTTWCISKIQSKNDFDQHFDFVWCGERLRSGRFVQGRSDRIWCSDLGCVGRSRAGSVNPFGSGAMASYEIWQGDLGRKLNCPPSPPYAGRIGWSLVSLWRDRTTEVAVSKGEKHFAIISPDISFPRQLRLTYTTRTSPTGSSLAFVLPLISYFSVARSPSLFLLSLLSHSSPLVLILSSRR